MIPDLEVQVHLNTQKHLAKESEGMSALQIQQTIEGSGDGVECTSKELSAGIGFRNSRVTTFLFKERTVGVHDCFFSKQQPEPC
jgi:uncharacterized protein YcgI (DUF1989 family)